MKADNKTSRRHRYRHLPPAYLVCAVLIAVLGVTSCSEIKRTSPEKYFSSTTPPRQQELRWTNGRTPKTADPAIAKAAPETDVVRALYEGLTELDAGNLSVRPAAAESWLVSEDRKTWTFQIRQNAVWSDGSPLTAEDFRRSWLRAARMGNTANGGYFSNIVGIKAGEKTMPLIDETSSSSMLSSIGVLPQSGDAHATLHDMPIASATPQPNAKQAEDQSEDQGLTVDGEKRLIVKLIEPDPDFARLAAHPIYRPVHIADVAKKDTGISSITNGAFALEKKEGGAVVLKRSDSYWNKGSVRLERVKIISSDTAEKALEAYRSGEVDAVTNAEFSPLVLKLLTPYEDLKKTTFAALNFYELNLEKPHFKDRRVREALAIAIERERLTDGELEGTTQPAFAFTPFGPPVNERIVQDKERAKDLFEDAGYPNGRDFPKIKLYINRNDTQQRIARSVAAMWKDVLNVECEVVVRDSGELEKAKDSKEYDLIRRGVVLTTPNKVSNTKTLFGNTKPLSPDASEKAATLKDPNSDQILFPTERQDESADNSISPFGLPEHGDASDDVLTQAEALHQVYAIPLYFPISFSLVKPYVDGFEANNIDAQFLQDVSIDETWNQGSAY